MDTLRRDISYAIRVLAKRPGFTLVATLTLAIGIAANSTIFTLVNGVLLRPLPYRQADRLVDLWTIYAISKGQRDIFSPPNYVDVAARAKSFEAVGAYSTFTFTLAAEGDPEFVNGIQMSASLADVLGVEPQAGRWFTKQEDEGASNVILIGDSLWRSKFAGDRAAVGSTVIVNGKARTIVGVLPPGIGFPSLQSQVYAPISFTAANLAPTNRGNVFLNVEARLRPGISLNTANAELKNLAMAMSREDKMNAGIQIGATSLQDAMVGSVRPMLLALWAAVAFMLAVGCANVANLLLTHAAGRQREFAVRRSLGATSWRLVRQLLTESVILAGLGGAVGLLLQTWLIPAIAVHLPPAFPRVREIGFDPRVVWITAGTSLLTGILFGLAPAFGAIRGQLTEALRDGERSGQSVAQRRFGNALVVAEIAAVLVLMVGAGLVLRSLARLTSVDPGFKTNGVIAWQFFLPSARYPDAVAQRAFYQRVVDQVQSLPGVQSAAIVQPLPFGPIAMVADSAFRIAGQPDPAPDQMPQGLVARAGTGYFATMGIPVLCGRVFDATDTETSTVVVISDALRRAYFGSEDPVGKHLLLGRSRLNVEIIGVVGDVKHNNPRTAIRPEFYLPMSRFTTGAAGLVVRTSGSPSAMMPGLHQRVWSVDPTLAGNLASPIDTIMYESLAQDRIAGVLLGVFAAVTLGLGLIGVYGVLSYSVQQRTREIGIRLALGASRQHLLRMVLGQALRMAGAGAALGLVAAYVLARYLETLLYRVEVSDPATYGVAGVLVPLAALLAACIPAIRATRVDPAMSLRETVA